MKNNIALVTGGAGFIGSHMVDLLLTKGFEVRIIDNLSGGHKNNLKHNLNNKKLKFKNLDICKLNPNEKFFKNVKYVFHFAGIGDIVPSIVKPAKYMLTNVQGTINVLEASRVNKIKKFVYAASASCYGKTKGNTSEKNKISLEHPYALSKYLGENSSFHWNKVYKLPVNSIRIFNAYGPRVRTTGAYGAVIGVFFKQKIANQPLTIVGDGKQSRDFVHVKDVAKAFFAAAKTNISGEVFNVGTGTPQTVVTLAKLIGGKVTKIPDRPGEPRVSKADIRKIKTKLRWKPQIQFKQGIENMLKDIKKWKNAPLWTPSKIKKVTAEWFSYLK
jgi:UDP-glucose 4-epimerase